MIKKDYLQPAIEVLKADTEAQILAGSLTDVSTTGLDEDIEFNDTSEDPWGFAW